MNWIHFSILTVILYSVHDVLLKQLSDKVSPTIASFLINAAATLSLALMIFLWRGNNKISNQSPLDLKTWALLIVAGCSLGAATITFMESFMKGGSFSIVLPIVYVGIILMSLLVGLLFFKESVSNQQWIGIALSLCGIYLMLKP